MKKKVYIITVYNSLNSGSFLQATSLYRSIEKLGFEVAFLNANIRNLWKSAIVEAGYMIRKLDLKSAFGKFIMASKITKELKAFNIVTLDKIDLNDENNIYILGSDEIWNVARKNMNQFPILWGYGLPMKQCISYAPSLNNATKEQLLSIDYVCEALAKLKNISVRDTYSLSTLQSITNREIVEVCDPTFLMEETYYTNRLKKPKYTDYILIYIYSKNENEHDIQALKDFAKSKKKKLIAFGSNMKWCDINVTGTPWDFLSYIYYADYVCTSTFHGTLFSAFFGKQFAVIGNRNRKVDELLQKLCLNRKTDSNGLSAMLDLKYDFEGVKQSISGLRDGGVLFLNDNLRE